jgi:V8-like Glu-specific endopeptidase
VLKTTSSSFTSHRRASSAMLALAVTATFGAVLVNAQDAGAVLSANGVTTLSVKNPAGSINVTNAKPVALPVSNSPADTIQAEIKSLLATPASGPSGGAVGSQGTGAGSNPVFVGTPVVEEGVSPEDFGTNNHPFTTVRADLFTENTNTTYPYRAAGLLTFCTLGSCPSGNNAYCSTSLIQPGVIVAAGHCVADYGQSKFYSNWQFYPAYRAGVAPYGVFGVKSVIIKTAYYNGTDGCYQYGVICPDDVSVLILTSDIGNTVGWFGYWYGGGFTSGGLEEITQLGYPEGLDSGQYMERTDSYGYINSTYSGNTILGTNMNAGSSGGPWVANFGLPSALTGETTGSFPQQNTVIGVTSWGYTSTSPKEAGASPFTANNIGSLISSACSAYPGNC